MSSAEMRAAAKRGEHRTDWARVKRVANRDPEAAAVNRKIGKSIARRRGRPVEGEPKTAISLRMPESVVARWRASGAGWQTRMVEILEKRAP